MGSIGLQAKVMGLDRAPRLKAERKRKGPRFLKHRKVQMKEKRELSNDLTKGRSAGTTFLYDSFLLSSARSKHKGKNKHTTVRDTISPSSFTSDEASKDSPAMARHIHTSHAAMQTSASKPSRGHLVPSTVALLSRVGTPTPTTCQEESQIS